MSLEDETDSVVQFYESWIQTGVGQDGLPLYETVIRIKKSKPLTETDNLATEFEMREFRTAWAAFEKERGARDANLKGYPLILWPVCSPALLKMCTVRDIYTVEQLAPMADNRDMPPDIREVAVRARKLIAMQGKAGRFEEIIHQLEGERDALREQLAAANSQISAQNALINMNHAVRAA